MKKTIASYILVLLLTGCAVEKLTVAQLPKPVLKSFSLAYPEVEAQRWKKAQKKSKTIYAALFIKDGKTSEAEFDEKGNFIREQYR